MSLDIPEKDIQFPFVMCKMIVSNEPANYKQYSTLVFAEFLEFVARVSDLKFKSMPDTTLA